MQPATATSSAPTPMSPTLSSTTPASPPAYTPQHNNDNVITIEDLKSKKQHPRQRRTDRRKNRCFSLIPWSPWAPPHLSSSTAKAKCRPSSLLSFLHRQSVAAEAEEEELKEEAPPVQDAAAVQAAKEADLSAMKIHKEKSRMTMSLHPHRHHQRAFHRHRLWHCLPLPRRTGRGPGDRRYEKQLADALAPTLASTTLQQVIRHPPDGRPCAYRYGKKNS